MNTDPANWMRLAIRRWLAGDGELTAMGLTGNDRQQARLALRNQRIRAAFNLIPGDRFSDRLAALVAAIERLNRVRQGYRHQRIDGAVFDELERAAHWAELPAERQLRNVICENNDPFELHETDCIINLKSLIQDINDEQLSTGTGQEQGPRRLRQVAGFAE